MTTGNILIIIFMLLAATNAFIFYKINQISFKYKSGGFTGMWSRIDDADKKRLKKYFKLSLLSVLVFIALVFFLFKTNSRTDVAVQLNVVEWVVEIV